jgi:hypothetical protein
MDDQVSKVSSEMPPRPTIESPSLASVGVAVMLGIHPTLSGASLANGLAAEKKPTKRGNIRSRITSPPPPMCDPKRLRTRVVRQIQRLYREVHGRDGSLVQIEKWMRSLEGRTILDGSRGPDGRSGFGLGVDSVIVGGRSRKIDWYRPFRRMSRCASLARCSLRATYPLIEDRWPDSVRSHRVPCPILCAQPGARSDRS